MNKKKLITTLVAVVAITSVTTGCGKKAKLKTDDKTVVALSGSKITAQNLYDELKKNSIEKLVDMIDHKILDKKYPADEEEKKSINSQIDEIKSYYQDDEDSYLAAITSYFGVKDEEELRSKLSLEFKRNKAVNDYLEKNIKDDEIQKYYNENVYGDIKASHILISVETTDNMSNDEKEKVKKEAYKKAEEVIKKLNNGEKFDKLAKEYSDDKANAKNGGELGYFNKDEMDPSFWNAALELKKDKYSTKPVESAYGYHIILKTGEKEKKSLDDVKDSIIEKLAKQKLSNDSSLYYESLMGIREDKKITFGDDELEKLYKEYMDDLIKQAKNNTKEQ